MSKLVPEETAREQSLRDLFYIGFRHKGKMLAWFLTVMAGVTAFTFLTPDTYCSTAKLLLRLGRESVTLDPTATTGPVISVSQSRANEIQAELEILQSQELIERLVSALGPEVICERTAIKEAALEWLGLKAPAANRGSAIQVVMDNLETSARSNIIRLSYKAGSPQSAQKVLAQLIELYLEMHIAVHQTHGAYEFFVQQSEELRRKLSQYEKDLQRLKDESGFSSLDEQLKLLLGQISATGEEIGRTSAEVKSSRAKVKRLEQIMTDLPAQVVISETTGLPSTAAEAMRQEMFNLRLEESKIQKNYRDDSRMVESIHEQISEAQAMLDKEKRTHTQVTQGPNATYQQLQLALLNEQTALADHQAKLEAQQQQLAEAKARLKTLNETEVTIRNLMREISVHETNYLRYSDNIEQARIEQAMEQQQIANINVVQGATLPVRRLRPRKLFNLIVGLFMATFGALTIALLSQYFDHTIQTPEQVEECLQLRTLACIPRRRLGRAFALAVCRGFSRILRKNSADRPVPWEVPPRLREDYDTLGERLTSSLNGRQRVVPYALGVV
ncbi:MAG: GumC family protein, partial [Planctomycetota bacterium]